MVGSGGVLFVHGENEEAVAPCGKTAPEPLAGMGTSDPRYLVDHAQPTT